MILFIIVIICAVLLVEMLSKESLIMASEIFAGAWQREFLEPSKNPLSFVQQKIQAGRPGKIASNSLHYAPCTMHLAFSSTERDSPFSGHHCQYLDTNSPFSGHHCQFLDSKNINENNRGCPYSGRHYHNLD